MAITQNTFNGNGSNLGPFSFTFKWLEPTDIKVTVSGVLKTAGTHYNLQNLNYATKSGGQVLFTAGNAPPAGTGNIRVYRQTDDTDLSAVFNSGSAIRAQDLNDNFTQSLYVAQDTATAQSNLETYVNDTFVEDTRVHLAANTWSDTDDYNIPTVKAVSDRLTFLRNNGFYDTRYYTETELNNGQLDTRYYTEAELNAGQLDTRYYTEAELNAGQLDNRYYTEAEADARFYNVNTESITSTDVWTNSDGFVATTAAIEARIITLVDEVGGFVPIATYTQFPTTNPDINNNAGTVVSIASVSGLTHSGGSSTNATTTGSTPVTITGIPGSLPSPATATGMLVVTTGTLNSYTFHRLTPEVNDVVNVANNATNINTVAGQISPTNNVGTVAGIAGNVSTVASNNANVTTVATNIANVNTNATNITNINTVAGINGNVSTVAGISANVTTVAGNTANINTVAGISGNVSTVANISSSVTTVSSNIASVTAVAADATDIGFVANNIGAVSAVGSDLANNFSNISDYGGITQAVTSTAGTSAIQTVADDIADVGVVAGISSSVSTVAGIASNVTAVASNSANVNTVAGNIANVNTTATNIANVNTVAGISGNVTAVVNNATNINAVAGNAANINTVAGISGNVTTVANNNANVTTVATNIANVNTCAANIVAIQNASTNAANAASSASAAATSASNASTSATAAAGSASAAATSAANALVSEQNADASEALALQYRDDTAAILTQSGSDAYNVSTNQSWGDIITGALNAFDNEILADILLTMSKGTNTYNYGTL
jgi:hypothetical protein